MPAVPKVPGVPLLRSYSLASSFVLIASDILRTFGGPLFTRWGVFRNGLPVIFADSTVSFDFKQDFNISDYPVEDGGFQSYNKVQLPSDVRVRCSAGGSEANRAKFMASIDAVIGSTDLFDIVTPERVYIGYCFSHQDFRRTAKNGAGLIIADLWFVEVRVTSTTTFTNTQQPGIAGQQSTGIVQPQQPSDGVLSGPIGNGGFF